MSFEKYISALVAKITKFSTGKGPSSVKTVIYDNSVIIKTKGHYISYEKEVAQTKDGYYHVKFAHHRYIEMKREKIKKMFSKVIGREIEELFFDTDPATETSVYIAFFKEK